MLHIDVRGAGAPLVLLHGSPQPPSTLVPLAERLAVRARVHLVHLPGWEGSAGTGPMPLAEATLVLGRQLAGLGPAVWVGMSLGFWRTLDLIAGAHVPAPRLLVGLGPAIDFSPEDRAGLGGAAGALRAGVDVGPILVPRFLSEGFAAAHPDEVEAIHHYCDGAARDATAVELEGVTTAPDHAETFRRCSIPRVLRVGALDVATPIARLQRLAAESGAELQVVPGAGHLINREDLEGTATAILTRLP